jgi:hypothetical protein|nr:MAG TPA: BNR/Asp-box repeat protein [Caudoviricetes sp.]
MTLELADGRGELFQWDAGRIIEFGDDTVSQAHFTSIEKITDIPYTIEVKNRKAAIPDELLQVPGTLIVYAWVSDTNGGYTKAQVNLPVFARPKPSDYVYTPTEHAGFDRLRTEIGDLADLTTEAKENLVAAINEAARSGGAGSMALRVADGYIQYSTDGGSTWTNLIAVADLKGADGKPGTAGADGVTPHIGDNGNWYLGGTDTGKPSRGAPGASGHTPVKGTDYWTAADKQEIIDDIHLVFYIDLAGKYPNYTCQVAMDDIKAAYNSGYNLVCRCALGAYTATLPLFVPMPAANTWIFSGSGALAAMGFPAQSLTIAIVNGTVQASDTRLASMDDIPTIPTALKNPNALTIKIGSTTVTYDGSAAKTVEIADGSEVSY